MNSVIRPVVVYLCMLFVLSLLLIRILCVVVTDSFLLIRSFVVTDSFFGCY